jgi:hypothetical protein
MDEKEAAFSLSLSHCIARKRGVHFFYLYTGALGMNA